MMRNVLPSGATGTCRIMRNNASGLVRRRSWLAVRCPASPPNAIPNAVPAEVKRCVRCACLCASEPSDSTKVFREQVGFTQRKRRTVK